MFRRVIERVVTSDVLIDSETNKKIIALALEELTKSYELVPLVQNHAMEILVAIGRGNDCNVVNSFNFENFENYILMFR